MSFRILLIEDDPISQEVIRSLLAAQGHHVEVAPDGFSALEKLTAARFDAALVDYHLPEMDGFALGRLIRDERRSQGSPPVLIGLTADRNGLAARRGSDAVFRAILPKPINPVELFATLDRLLEQARPMRLEPAQNASTPPSALWHRHGLARAPRAFVAPPPRREQVSALSLCFDLVPQAEAEFVLLIERHGIKQALHAARPATGPALPIAGVSADLADICDFVFEVSDIASWSSLAGRLGASAMEAAVIAAFPEADEVRQPSAVPEGVSPPELTKADARFMSIKDAGNCPGSAATSQSENGPARIDSLQAARRALNILTACLTDQVESEAAGSVGKTGILEPGQLIETLIERCHASTVKRGLSFGLRLEPEFPSRLIGDATLFSELVSVALDDASWRWESGEVLVHLGFSPDPDSIAVRLVATNAKSNDEVPEVLSQLARLRAMLFRRSVLIGGGELPHGAMEDGMPTGFTFPVRRDAQSEDSSEETASMAVPCVVDGAKRSALMAAIGVAAVSRLSRHLLADVERVAALDDGNGWWQLSELSSCAAMLGFDELAAICARLQTVRPNALKGTASAAIEHALKRVEAVLGDISAAA